MLGRPAQVQWPPFITSSTVGVPVPTTACSSSSRRPGNSRDDRDAASPIMFHSPATTTATSAASAMLTARRNSASASKPSGSSGRLWPNMSNIEANTRWTTGMPGADSTRTRSPTLRRMPSSTVTVSSRSKSNTQAEDVAARVGQRPDHRHRPAVGVQRQQVALVAQQDRGPLGGDPGDLACRGSASTWRARSSST